MPEVINLDQEGWRVGEQLGAGGFGKVYLAQSGDGTPAVVKLIRKDPGAKRELLFEELDGLPNVVPVLDRGEWDDYWALVMPRAEKSLREYLDEVGGPLSADATVEVLVDIAGALVAIEDRCIVHRDIKPANILLLGGHWCLADFGISRYAEATTAPDTHKHAMTPPYAAPEQWRGDQATSATDVYATGLVAYELLAGQPPFLGPDYRRQHLGEDPGPLPNVPPRIQSLVAGCLNKSAQARPTPQNLLTQLRKSVQLASEGAQRLQQANQIAVSREAEVARQQSVARSEKERRHDLFEAAAKSWVHIVRILREQIAANAPAAKISKGFAWPLDGAESSVQKLLSIPLDPWLWSLNGAKLIVDPLRMAELQSGERSPFEVVAYSSVSIALRVSSDQRGYTGRSHSLWYCDARDPGVFRWYETAFFSLLGKSAFKPFALDPGRSAYGALSTVVDEYQVARKFTPIDQGDEEDFIERWMGWFADAAQGRLYSPRSMPEQDPSGSWRLGP